jgi:5-methylcytosine-specific restriction endonuclease McrA
MTISITHYAIDVTRVSIFMSSLKGTGSSNKWRKIREQIIRRDGCCQMCGSDERLSVDHIVPRTLGGNDNPNNLQVLCSSCNSSKGGRFFDRGRTPPTLPVSFYPENASTSHYRLESDTEQS